MSLNQEILKYAPSYWDKTLQNREENISSSSDEFKNIFSEITKAVYSTHFSVQKIIRIQNIHDLGQLLIREQLLVTSNPHTQYYRVRRFIKINKLYYGNAIKYNIDHRRCGLPQVQFRKSVGMSPSSSHVLLVVQVVTDNPSAEYINPANSLEYFIEYVVFFKTLSIL
ncbi:uncharacterized protein LOC115878362 [Sitophilus oryzae]|uniref:Uncharacterized protein LOC115878362 n=1 Tax=Sitophilus oryzae TaxID=7048 RepID=A0A6J2XHE2_SITOR|nr:uncharacterized protein LOC115878362 [Sitophilus oryzae]